MPPHAQLSTPVFSAAPSTWVQAGARLQLPPPAETLWQTSPVADVQAAEPQTHGAAFGVTPSV